MTDCVIGLDVGTTSAKAVAFDASGEELATAEQSYPTHHPAPGTAEQDPQEVADRSLDAIADVVEQLRSGEHRVAAISVSTAMHSLIGLDADGDFRTPMVLFSDSRARAEAAEVRREHGQAVYRRTGTPIHAMSPLVKLRWYAAHDRDTFTSVRHWISGKELVLAALHGRGGTVDQGIASATGLYNLRDADWDAGALELAGIDRDQLAEPVSTRHVLDGLGADAAGRTGLDRGTPVVVGAGDGALANLGVGSIREGMAAATIGTSGAVRVITGAPDTDPQGRTFCYVLTGEEDEPRYLAGGAVTNGGSALAYLREQLLRGAGGTRDYDELVALAESVVPGAAGLIFLPWLNGERAPRWRSGLSGALLGLRSDHTEAHVVRAAMEGVLLQLRLVTDALRETTGELSAIRATGGFRKSAAWSQMMADVLNHRIDFTESTQAAAFGAALLGMSAIGWIDDLDDVADLVAVEDHAEPDRETVRTYDRVARTYDQMVGQLIDGGIVDALADLRDDLTAADHVDGGT